MMKPEVGAQQFTFNVLDRLAYSAELPKIATCQHILSVDGGQVQIDVWAISV
jgi:pentose-5-phosphate-3-epimerase